MNFYNWMEAVDKEKLSRRYQSSIVEEFNTNNYNMYIVHSPFFPKPMDWQIAIEHKDKDFSSYEDQMSKNKNFSLKNRSEIKEILNQLDIWLEKNKNLTVGSTNPEKTKKWVYFLEKFGYNLDKIYVIGGVAYILSSKSNKI